MLVEVGKPITLRDLSQKTSGIYKIINTTNSRFYIGQSHNVWSRWKSHVSNLQNGSHIRSLLQRDWNLLGPSCFEFILVEEISDPVVRRTREHAVIFDAWMSRQPLYIGGQIADRLRRAETSEIEREMWLNPGSHEWMGAA